jgi:hypothetical protein
MSKIGELFPRVVFSTDPCSPDLCQAWCDSPFRGGIHRCVVAFIRMRGGKTLLSVETTHGSHELRGTREFALRNRRALFPRLIGQQLWVKSGGDLDHPLTCCRLVYSLVPNGVHQPIDVCDGRRVPCAGGAGLTVVDLWSAPQTQTYNVDQSHTHQEAPTK